MLFVAVHESVPDTKRTWWDVRRESVMRTEADVRQRLGSRKKLGRGEVNLRALMIQHPK
jgi:hypothetical protein